LQPQAIQSVSIKTTKTDPFTDAYMEMEVVGANGVRQVITTTGTFYNGDASS